MMAQVWKCEKIQEWEKYISKIWLKAYRQISNKNLIFCLLGQVNFQNFKYLGLPSTGTTLVIKVFLGS